MDVKAKSGATKLQPSVNQCDSDGILQTLLYKAIVNGTYVLVTVLNFFRHLVGKKDIGDNS